MASSNVIKTMVSKNKKRFEEGKFNLDLSYITPRIIAMGYPAQDIEKLYRNNARDVLEFLNERHPGHYKLFNLCRERQYSAEMFEGRVEWEPFEDHKPPRIEQIEPFCRKVQQWLDEHPKNVVAVHCKAGKGRTGVMICCYLLYSGEYKTPAEVLKFYGDQRTKDGKGVTIPSQRRYVEYFHRLRQERRPYRPPDLFLQAITLEPEQPLESIFTSMHFTVKTRCPAAATAMTCNGESRPAPLGSLQSRDTCNSKHKERTVLRSAAVELSGRGGDTCLRIPAPLGGRPVSGDFKVELVGRPRNKLRPKEKLCWLWLNTHFVGSNGGGRLERASSCPEDDPSGPHPVTSSCSEVRIPSEAAERITLSVPKHELDKACKDSRLQSNFKMHLTLVRRPGHVGPRPAAADGHVTRQPHPSGSDSESDSEEDEFPADGAKETTHL